MAWGEDYFGRVFFKLCNYCARLHSHARVCEVVLHMSRHRMRAPVYALCRSNSALHNFHGLAEFVGRGAGVCVKNLSQRRAKLERVVVLGSEHSRRLTNLLAQERSRLGVVTGAYKRGR